MRTLIDLAIERIHLAGMGDIEWKEALAAMARAVHVDRAMLFTPELAPDSGGLFAVHESRRGPGEIHAGESDEAFSAVLGDGGERTMPATLFVLLRARGTAGFTKEERGAIDLVARHVSLAARLWFRKRVSKHGAEALASSLNAAALIVDADSCVAWMNHQANAWVQGRRISIARGRLVEVPGVPVDLPRVIRETVGRRTSSGVTVAGDLTLEIAPVPMPRAETRRPSGKAALVLLRDRAGCRQVAAFLAATFRLTATEVDLAIALWKGVLVAEYASQRSVAMSTVRTQLKALLAKTGSRRQSDVVSLVARMQPLLGNPALSAASVMAEASRYGRDIPTSRDTSNG